MRYEGSYETIVKIEHQIKSNALCFIKIKPHIDELFGIKSIVETKVYDVLIPKQAYLFPVRLFYDGRNQTGAIDVRDRDVWWLCKICPEILKLIGELKPQKFEKRELLGRENHKR